MDISNINENLDKMNVDKPTKEGITNIIDLKITDDMEKVLQNFNAKMDSFSAEMRSFENRFATQMDADRKISNEKFEADRKIFAERTTTLTVVISVVGIVLTIIGLFLLFKK